VKEQKTQFKPSAHSFDPIIKDKREKEVRFSTPC